MESMLQFIWRHREVVVLLKCRIHFFLPLQSHPISLLTNVFDPSPYLASSLILQYVHIFIIVHGSEFAYDKNESELVPGWSSG